MSDISINVPVWLVVLFVGTQVWPIVLILAGAALVAAFVMRGPSRWAALGLASLLAADLAFDGVLAGTSSRDDSRALAYEHSIETTLAAETVVGGLKLPAGTDIVWTDPTHANLAQATLPHPAVLFGLLASSIQREVDDGWALRLSEPQSVDGWTCHPDLVELDHAGHLQRCTTESARNWNGWPIPATTLVTPHDQTVGFVFPPEAPVPAPEIGRPIPATGSMTMNADGSLDRIYFEPDAPLLICGVSLWNTVAWRYDSATLGQGRDRKPVAVSGASPSGNPIERSLPCAK